MLYSTRYVAVVLTAILAACGPTGDGGGGGGGGGGGVDGSPNGTPDSGGGELVDADPNRPDSGCGLQEEEVELINQGDPPDMLIVLDRSGSMGSPINIMNPFGPTYWTVMRDALKSIVMQTENNIRWGLSVFPTDNMCGVAPGPIEAIADANYTPIKNWLDSNSPDGNTPAHLALQDALTVYQGIPVNPEGQFVLWATDGVPNCDDTDNDAEGKTLAAVQALRAAGIKTYVIGFGNPFGLPTTLLNDAADAGGTARAGNPKYYEATDAASLQMALEQISGGVIVPSCSYALTETPPDPDMVRVTIDGTPVPRSTQHTNGWDYYPDSMTITFFGTYCDDIESGSVSSVEFFFGCPGPVID